MQQRVSVITLGVRDLERSRAFYEDGLGWSAMETSDEIAFYAANGLVIGLYTGLADELPTPAGPPAPGGMALANNQRSREDVDRVVAEVVAAGGTVLAPPTAREWGGYSGYVADPDGHPWEIAHNPFWPLADDGSLQLPT